MSNSVLAFIQKATTAKLTPVVGAVLQRQCACGQHTMGGECKECKANKGLLQRKPANESSASEVPPIVHEVVRSPGQPLDPATRAFFEPRFGYDFSQVMVHTNAKAAESARAVNALAYTVERNIVLGSGQYAPGTDEGRHLLAHELSHVVQQGRSGFPVVPHPVGGLSYPGDAAEREADAVADQIATRDSVRIQQPCSQGVLYRQMKDAMEDEGVGQREPTRRPGEPLPYREAMEMTEQGLRKEYRRNCAGIRVLERLERQEVSPLERVKGLERRLRVIPHLFEAKRQIDLVQDPQIRAAQLQQFQQEIVEGEFPKFPPGYALSSEEDELARARCELSEARWKLLVFVRTGRIPGELLRRR